MSDHVCFDSAVASAGHQQSFLPDFYQFGRLKDGVGEPNNAVMDAVKKNWPQLKQVFTSVAYLTLNIVSKNGGCMCVFFKNLAPVLSSLQFLI